MRRRVQIRGFQFVGLRTCLRVLATALLVAVEAALIGSPGCGTPPPPPPPPITFETKMSWILRLEDLRVLRDPAPLVVPALPPGAGSVVPQPPPVPDLLALLTDREARVRRRAALAVGRVGLPAGIAPLQPLLGDGDPEVRQMAAFALGLIGDTSAVDPLRAALADPSPIVQGRAAEALGLIGAPAAAAEVGALVRRQASAAGVADLAPDDDRYPLDPAIEAFQLGVYALVRLHAYDPLAAAVLDGSGQPTVRWWPVAYALGRLEDTRALAALLTLARTESQYTRAFAIKGLGALRDRQATAVLLPLAALAEDNPAIAIEAVRALGRIADPQAASALMKIAAAERSGPMLRAEAITSLAVMPSEKAVRLALDLLTDASPVVRAATLRSLVRMDRDAFVAVLSGLDPDKHWSVRAAVASALAELRPEIGVPRLRALLGDTDQRVIPSVLAALVKLRAPNVETLLYERLTSDDFVARISAATLVGELKPAAGPAALVEAYRFGGRDDTYGARAAALAALAGYGPESARDTLTAALADKDWAVRVRAAELLTRLDPSSDVSSMRPAPTSRPIDGYRAEELVNPRVSPHAYIETDKGTIQIELAVVDAPLTVENFISLARKGFFNGVSIHRVVPNFVMQDGDPRGDGEGGPGYTIRDELNERPYLRGTVGMALDWKDTGGSQFFITHSPQPHLDARYSVFGYVIGGMDVVDRLDQWDVIRRVRVWDGVQMTQN